MRKNAFTSSKCKVPNCDVWSTPDKRFAFEMCLKHYRRWRRNGSPLDEFLQIAPQGAYEVAYITIHQRLQKERGKASEHDCVSCYRKAEEWAYDHDDSEFVVTYLRGKATPYSLDLEHYIPLCRRCHKEFDYGRSY